MGTRLSGKVAIITGATLGLARRQKYVYPLGSPAQPEQVADVMLFLASDESATITGHSLVADRGATVFNPLSVLGRLETNIRDELEAQGSEWIKGEK